MRKTLFLSLATLFFCFSGNSQGFKFNPMLDQEVSCKGNNDGSVLLSCLPEGDYTYTISRLTFFDKNKSGIFRNLVPGVYRVTASNGKETQISKVTVTEPKALGIKFIVETYPTTKEPKNGAINLEITGGTTDIQPYLVKWENSEGTVINDNIYEITAKGLIAGTYSVTIEDDHGCFLTKKYKLVKKK